MNLFAFPTPSELIQSALQDLELLTSGDPETVAALLTNEPLPRPWDITTVHDLELRRDIWNFLDASVTWYNSQHAWTAQEQIPACWPKHPPLIHAIGSLMFQRYYVGEAADPNALEEWHRYALPAFDERTRAARLACHDDHQIWPGRAQYNRHISSSNAALRKQQFQQDCHDQRSNTQPQTRFTVVTDNPGR